MEKRNTGQRRRQLVELLQSLGEASVEQLATHFNTSEVTIRKDLAELELNGLLLRRHGGAMLIPKEIIADTSSDKKLSKQKLNIAKLAASLIRDHNRIVIDSGKTTSALLPELSTYRGLVVMTNSLWVANALLELENEPTVLMTGGTWDERSESFQGHVAEKILKEYDFDQLFIGADGLDIARGTTTYNEIVGLSQTMASVSREVIVLAESTKLNRKIPNLELAWDSIDILVCDDGIDSKSITEIEARGVRVLTTKS